MCEKEGDLILYDAIIEIEYMAVLIVKTEYIINIHLI